MSPEIYTIIAVAIALAGLILNGQRSLAVLRREMGELRSEMHREFAAVRGEMRREIDGLRKEIDGLRKQIDGLREEIRALAERVVRLEGILARPREAAVGKGA